LQEEGRFPSSVEGNGGKEKEGLFRVYCGALGKGDQKVILQTNHSKQSSVVMGDFS